MAAITEVSPNRKRSARLLALAYVLSWAFVFGLLLWLSAPVGALQSIRPVSIWLGLLVFLVLGALIVLSIGETVARMDEDHHGPKALPGWVAAGLIGGLFSGLTNLPFILNNESGWASLVRNILWFGGPLLGYALAFRRNPITTLASLPSAESPPWTYRLAGGFFLFVGIVGTILGVWIVNGILTKPGFREPLGMVVTVPISLAAIAFGWTFSHYKKPYNREAVVIACTGLLLSLIGAVIGIIWLIWG